MTSLGSRNITKLAGSVMNIFMPIPSVTWVKRTGQRLACRLQRGRTQCGVAASERENRSPLWTPFLHTPPGGGDEQPHRHLHKSSQQLCPEYLQASTQLLLSYNPSRKSESCSQPSCPRTGARQRQTHRGIPLSNEKE